MTGFRGDHRQFIGLQNSNLKSEQTRHDTTRRTVRETNACIDDLSVMYRVGQKKLRQIFLAITLVNMDRY